MHQRPDFGRKITHCFAETIFSGIGGNHEVASTDLDTKPMSIVCLRKDELPKPHVPETVQGLLTEVSWLNPDTLTLSNDFEK